MLPQDHSGGTPLALACARGYVETARVLLEYRAYVDQQNKVYFIHPRESAD
jgi:ankyrin repeat protein